MPTLEDFEYFTESPEYQNLSLSRKRQAAEGYFDELFGKKNNTPDKLKAKAEFTDLHAPMSIKSVGTELAKEGATAVESAASAVPGTVEDLWNTGSWATRGIIPKAPPIRKTIEDAIPLISSEESQYRNAGKLVGSIPAYIGGGLALKGLTKAPKIAKALYPLLPVKGIAGNVAQSAIGGAESAISESVKRDEDVDPLTLGTSAAASGALTAVGLGGAKILGSKFLKSPKTDADIRGVKSKADIEGDVLTNQIRSQIRGEVAPKAELEVTGKLLSPDLEPQLKTGLRTPDDVLKTATNIAPIKSAAEEVADIQPGVRGEQPMTPLKEPEVAPVQQEPVMMPRDQNIKGSAIPDQAQFNINKAAQETAEVQAKPGVLDESYGKVEAQQEPNPITMQWHLDQLKAAKPRNTKPTFALKEDGTARAVNSIESIEGNKAIKMPTKKAVAKEGKKIFEQTKEKVQNKKSTLTNKKEVLKKQGLKPVKKKSEDTKFKGGPLMISSNPLIELTKRIAQGARTIGAKVHLEPRKILEKTKDFTWNNMKLKDVADIILGGEVKARMFFSQVENKYMTAMSKINLVPQEFPKVAAVLDAIKSLDIVNNNFKNLDLSVVDADGKSIKGFDPLRAQEALKIWETMSEDSKTFTILAAKFFKESGKFLGIDERMLAAYLPHFEDLNQWAHLARGTKSTDPPSFLYSRAKGSELKSISIPELMMRYATGVRRKILHDVIEQAKFEGEDGLIKAARDIGRHDIANASERIIKNIKDIYDPGEIGRLIDSGMRNFVEQSLRMNVSSGLLNMTQTLQFLWGEAGTKNYLSSVDLLIQMYDDLGKGKGSLLADFLDELDLKRTSTAKFDVQTGLSDQAASIQGFSLKKAFQENLARFTGGDKGAPNLNAQAKALNDLFKDYADSVSKRVVIDAFQSPELYLNQPLAVISGMLKQVGGDKQVLLQKLAQIQAVRKSGDMNLANQLLQPMFTEGIRMNETVNFARTQSNRPAYETFPFFKHLLPFLNFPIKEAGYAQDTFYNLISSINEGNKLEAAEAGRALGTYFLVKGLIGGPKKALTLVIPAGLAVTFQNVAPDQYRDWEDKLELLDEWGNIPKRFLGLDFSGTTGYLDPTAPLAGGKTSDFFNVANAPILKGVSRATKGISKIGDKDASGLEKAAGVADAARFLPIPSYKGKGIEIGVGAGQTSEILKSADALQKGERKVGRDSFPTDLGKEIKRNLGTLPEDLAIYNKNTTQAGAKRFLEKGKAPSEASIKSLIRAKGLEEDRFGEDKVLDSLSSSIKTGYKKKYYEAYKRGDDERMQEIVEILHDMGLNNMEIRKYLLTKKKNEKGFESPKAIMNRRRRVNSLRRNLD